MANGGGAKNLRRLIVLQIDELFSGLVNETFECDCPSLPPQDVGEAEGEGAVASRTVPILVREFLLFAGFDDKGKIRPAR